MLTALLVLFRSIGLICGGHRAVALENLALRQQLAALTRTVKHSKLRTRDRLFWILLAKAWRGWRTALIVVQPDTVVGGTAGGSVDCGRGARDGHVRGAQTRMSRCERSSAQWPRRIRCGARRRSTANCASWASRTLC